MEYLTIKDIFENEIIVNKSRFISFLYPCSSKEEVTKILNDLHQKYADATHICYAYIIFDNNQVIYKCDDNGEPASTAGMPILNILKKNEIINVICVVIRYFGGIKLGAGGLIRTYGKSASEVLKKAKIVKYQSYYQYDLTFNYSNLKLLEKIIQNLNGKIQKKNFLEMVTYQVAFINKDDVEILYTKLNGCLKYNYLNEIYLE